MTEKLNILCGFHAVYAAISRGGNVSEVIVDVDRRDGRMKKIIQLANTHSVTVTHSSRKVLDEQSNGIKHQGVIALTKSVSEPTQGDLISYIQQQTTTPLVLVLDQVQDPHNLGACLRVADGAGVTAVVLPKDGAVKVNDTVRRVAAGAAEHLPIYSVVNLSRTLDTLQQIGLWVVGAADEAEGDMYSMDYTVPTVIVMGAEGSGLRHLTKRNCDHLVSIPMLGGVSSLNVSVATGVMLYETVRQRQLKKA